MQTFERCQRQIDFYRRVRSGKSASQLARDVGLSQGRVHQIQKKGKMAEDRALGLWSAESTVLDVMMEDAVTSGHTYSFSLDGRPR